MRYNNKCDTKECKFWKIKSMEITEEGNKNKKFNNNDNRKYAIVTK